MDTVIITREELARVCWPRLLDLAPLTLDERHVIGRLSALVTDPNDEIARVFRERCLREASA